MGIFRGKITRRTKSSPESIYEIFICSSKPSCRRASCTLYTNGLIDVLHIPDCRIKCTIFHLYQSTVIPVSLDKSTTTSRVKVVKSISTDYLYRNDRVERRTAANEI